MKVEFGTVVAVDCQLGRGVVKLASEELNFFLAMLYIPKKEPWEVYPRVFRKWSGRRRKNELFYLPKVGGTIAVLRDFGGDGIHAWINEAEWDWCLEKDDFLPSLRVVRMHNGSLAEVVWEGDPKDHGRDQLRKLSLLFPRTFSYTDTISTTYREYESTGSITDGLLIQRLDKEGGSWTLNADCRAPWAEVPLTRWGLDLTPITTAVK